MEPDLMTPVPGGLKSVSARHNSCLRLGFGTEMCPNRENLFDRT